MSGRARCSASSASSDRVAPSCWSLSTATRPASSGSMRLSGRELPSAGSEPSGRLRRLHGAGGAQDARHPAAPFGRPQRQHRQPAAALALRTCEPRARAHRGRAPDRAAARSHVEPSQRITTLSGGNQQKALLGTRADAWTRRAAPRRADTRRGCRREVGDLRHHPRHDVDTASGCLVASSEIPEILAIADRCAVLSRGRLAGILRREEMNEAAILTLAFAGH